MSKTYEPDQLCRIVEGALLAAGEALSLDRFMALFDEEEQPSKEAIVTALETVQADCQDKGYALVEVATGWRFQVNPELAPWVNRLWEEKPQKYSRALLETLALIAYRQPLTRSDIEEVRGVAVSSHIIKTLAEREWIKVVGQRDVPGRPSLYATTKQFLEYFGLKSLDELPTLSELQDIDSLNQSLALGEGDSEAEEKAQILDAQEQAEQSSGEQTSVPQDSDEPAPFVDEASEDMFAQDNQDSGEPEALDESDSDDVADPDLSGAKSLFDDLEDDTESFEAAQQDVKDDMEELIDGEDSSDIHSENGEPETDLSEQNDDDSPTKTNPEAI